MARHIILRVKRSWLERSWSDKVSIFVSVKAASAASRRSDAARRSAWGESHHNTCWPIFGSLLFQIHPFHRGRSSDCCARQARLRNRVLFLATALKRNVLSRFFAHSLAHNHRITRHVQIVLESSNKV